VNELPQVEENKNQPETLKHSMIRSNTKYYLLNGILGLVGSLLFLLFMAVAATQSQRLPPDWEEQSFPNTSLLFIMLLFLLIIITVNIIGVISFTKKNKDAGSHSKKLLKFILLNFATFISSFIAFILICFIFLKL
jgi:heme/copper-type cytochrome/quinol oxidase subunit 2